MDGYADEFGRVYVTLLCGHFINVWYIENNDDAVCFVCNEEAKWESQLATSVSSGASEDISGGSSSPMVSPTSRPGFSPSVQRLGRRASS